MASNANLYQAALVTAIQALNLTLIPSNEIVARRRPYNLTGVFRGITIHPLEDGEIESHGTEAREDIGYPFGISIYVGNDHSVLENIDKVPLWKETIRRKIINRRTSVTLPSGDTNLITQMAGGKLHLPKEEWRYELSTMFVRCWAREART